jgi:lipopolysaccharide biosynthesis glycosyltransferase
MAYEKMNQTIDDHAIVVTAADDAFAMQLATMGNSLGANSSGPVDLYVLDGGISDDNKQRVTRSLPESIASLRWLNPDQELVSDLKLSHHIAAPTYYRLQLAELLPEACHRIIYLDTDLIVLKDIQQLWNLEMDGRHILAAQDLNSPRMDASTLKNYDKCRRFITCQHPLIQYQQLGIPGSAKCFNAGVLLIDMQKWRRDHVGATVLEFLQTNSEHIQFWDQDGLNAVLWDKWSELRPAWNQMPAIHLLPGWQWSPFDRNAFEEAVHDPAIVHFAGSVKPWRPDMMHPSRIAYFEYLDRTAWAGWGPEIRREWRMRLPGLWSLWQQIKRNLRRMQGAAT